MTLRKQLTLLAAFIIAIPVLCIFFITTNNYFQFRRRAITRDEASYKMLEENEKSLFSKSTETLTDTFDFLPPEMDSFLIDGNGKIVISTIKGIPAGITLDATNIIPFIQSAEEKYIYQFTTHVFDDSEYTLITRFPKKELTPKNPKDFLLPLLIIIASLVAVSVIILFEISKNMFRSIVNIQKQMSQIADGNLDVEIICDAKIKTNEISSISKSLETMREALVSAQNRKNKFIMGISHDLRTPVAIIKGYTEAIIDGVIKGKEDRIKAIKLIKAKSTHLENMINTLINFVKLENSDLRKTLTPQPIVKFIKHIASDAENTIGVFNRKLTSSIDIQNEYIIPYDEQLLNRVFENLIGNALRYTEEGDEIKIIAFEQDNNLFVKICDTGIGISENDLANIFDLFYRASNSRREEGMGIGLSVVKNIIETHGWKINVESEKGKGSCFTIIIPIPDQEAQK
ncbi:sensor histidine kinase KdpD [Treponema sp. C6A8]|uniref:sensor histidine kinase n=1 Tax=Treponema sp. C6A8 TaxID=1410609 RepID=UPI0004800618|nr:HAMP domain-containing sensor histidine kinase [Treponema sp. C6A8]